MAIGTWERLVYIGCSLLVAFQVITWTGTYVPAFIDTWDRFSDQALMDRAYCIDVCDLSHKYGKRTYECDDACHNAHSWQSMRALNHVSKSFSVCGVDTPCMTALMDVISSPLGVLTAALFILGLPAMSFRMWGMFSKSGSTRSEYRLTGEDWERRDRYRGVRGRQPIELDPPVGSAAWKAYFAREAMNDRSLSIPLMPDEQGVFVPVQQQDHYKQM